MYSLRNLKYCYVQAILDLKHFSRTKEINISYENWKYDQVLAAILPEDCEGVAGFSQVGHIVHLNLRDEVLEYKKIIG